jgi:hypothetical protein
LGLHIVAFATHQRSIADSVSTIGASVNVLITPFQSGHSATNDLYEETMVRLLEVKVDLMTEDTTSRVSGGYLKLRCWLKTFRLKKRRGMIRAASLFPVMNVIWAHLDDDEDFDEKNIYCLPVLETRWGGLHGSCCSVLEEGTSSAGSESLIRTVLRFLQCSEDHCIR